MMYTIALILSTVMGYLALRLIARERLDTVLSWLLGAALGFGINGLIVFYVQLCFGWHPAWAAPVVSVLILGILLYLNYRNLSFPHAVSGNLRNFGLLAIIAFFLTCEALYYPIGGWDAWSCWNLKAKFIYLGGENWKTLFDPLLWRSNTQYPLLLPCINVWFWDLAGGDYIWVPMLNAVVFTVLCAGVLLFGLQKLTGQKLLPIVLTAAAFLLPFNITLNAGQYSDILVGLFLLCAFVCLAREEFVLTALFLGLLSFTKTEGTVAAGILTFLILLKKKKSSGPFLTALLVASLPTIIFTLAMAPRNEAFINGLTSALKPSTWPRLQAVGVFPLFELISLKWNGIWLLLLGGLALKWKTAFGSKLRVFGIFMGIYLVIVLAYYQVNTFFDVIWWMQNTLHRILFALLPSLLLWLGLAL